MSEEKNILEETASTVAEKVRKTRRNYHKKENYKQEEGIGYERANSGKARPIDGEDRSRRVGSPDGWRGCRY